MCMNSLFLYRKFLEVFSVWWLTPQKKLSGILFLLEVDIPPVCTQFRNLNGIRIKSLGMNNSSCVTWQLMLLTCSTIARPAPIVVGVKNSVYFKTVLGSVLHQGAPALPCCTGFQSLPVLFVKSHLVWLQPVPSSTQCLGEEHWKLSYLIITTSFWAVFLPICVKILYCQFCRPSC